MASSRLSVVINAVPLAPGGGMVCLLGYLNAWRELGVNMKVTVYASRRMVLDGVCETWPEIEVVPFAVGAPPWKHFLLQQTRLGPAIMQNKPDLVVSSGYGVRTCPVPQLIRHENMLRLTYRTIWSRLRHPTPYHLRESVVDFAARYSLRHATANVFISEYMRRVAERLFPESAPRNHVIYNGLSRETIEASQVSSSGWSGQPTLVAVQDTLAHKDNCTLIQTFARLVEMRPAVAWKLQIAGGGNWIKIKSMIRKWKLDNRITFCGYVDHGRLDALLRQSLCLVFTSICEGFGLPPVEAMARRCPVVACDCTAMPEVIGDAGILVPPGDAGAFAESIVELYENKQKRQQLIDRGLARIQKYCWHDSAEAMFNLFHKTVT